jgi:hypothetical protein
LVDCILSNDTFQDFTVLNPITVSGIRININTWYGKGGGLSYVQIYQSGKQKQRCAFHDFNGYPNENRYIFVSSLEYWQWCLSRKFFK